MASILTMILGLDKKELKQRTKKDWLEASDARGRLKAACKRLHTEFERLDSAIAHTMMRDLIHYVDNHPGQSWKNIGFKDLSNRGFDTRQRGHIGCDYGNKAYTLLLQMLCWAFPWTWGAFVRFLSGTWETLSPEHRDSDNAVEMKGDLVEIFLAFGRGEAQDIFIEGFGHRAEEHVMFISALNGCCDAVSEIVVLTHEEREPWQLRTAKVPRARPSPFLRHNLFTTQEAAEWEGLSWREKAAAVLAMYNFGCQHVRLDIANM